MKAFILVDIQTDFMPGGALPVKDGDKIVPIINSLLCYCYYDFELVVTTMDCHPLDHCSFAETHPGKKPGDVIEINGKPQILWPMHCVEGSVGYYCHPSLDLDYVADFVHKGTDPNIDSYSGFFDNDHQKSTGMGEFLKERKITEVYIAGLATDYCVKYTALDAVNLGFKTHVLEDVCRGVELKEGDVAKAIQEMKNAGVQVMQSGDVACRES